MTARLRNATLIALPLCALPLAALAVLSPVAASAADAPSADLGQALAVTPVPVTAGPEGPGTVVDDATPGSGVDLTSAATATFRVTYHGFSPAAKAAFQRAVNTWSHAVRSSVPITIDATYRPLGTGILGSAGPSLVFKNFSGAPKKDTFYVDALANKLHGGQLSAKADIVANFSSSFNNWSFSTGPAPAGKYDFQSVVTHELGHGLGFLGAGAISGGKGTVKLQGTPIVYDRFTENGSGKSLLSFPSPSTALKGQLTGGNLFLDSPAVRAANGGNRAKLYAPARYNAGSTYSHLDEATYRAGNKNSLMTPQLGMRETIRTPGPIVLAAFRTFGW